MVRLGVLYTLNHGSSPCEQTMKIELTESIINQTQSFYDEVGNIKKVAKKLHIYYERLRNVIKSKTITPKKRDTSSYRKNVKKRLIEYKGGKCQICGYNKCQDALEFHHLDPSKKDFTISNDHFKLLDAIAESKKCILICSNCHKELHDGLWTIDELNLKEMEEVEPNGID